MNKETKQALMIAILLMALLGLVKHIGQILPGVKDVGFAVIFLFQIFLPIWIIERNNESLSDYKLGFIDYKSISWRPLWQDLKRTIIMSLVVLVPYLGLFHLWSQYFPVHIPRGVNFSWPNFVMSQFLIVALSEEIFYRGFLQTRLLRQWPNHKYIAGLPVGFAIMATNAIFAFGHFIGEYNIFRLAPFFPGFLFSYLAFRSNSVLGAIVFHAISNIFGQFLNVFYFWK